MHGLLERDDELDIVRAGVTALWREHRGTVLVVTGPAGLGKTTVLAALQESAGAAGLLVLTARGGEQEQGVAFHVVRGLLEPLLGPDREAEQRELLGAWHDIVGPSVGVEVAGTAPDPQGVRDGLDWIATNLAFARGPLVLVIDDAHWADAESLSWLAAFAERISTLPILLAVAYRNDELPQWADVFHDIGGEDGVRLLGLSALTPDARCLARAVEEPPPAAERAQVLFELGCSTLLYDPLVTSEHLRTALEQPAIPVRLREEVSVRLAQSLAHSDDLAQAADIMKAEAQRATDPAVRLKMRVWHLMWGAFDTWEEGSTERSRQLAELAEQLDAVGDRSVAARYLLGLRGWDATVRGEPTDLAFHYGERALQGELRWAHPDWGFEVPVLVALTYLYGDRPERALELFDRGIAEYERAGWRGAHLAFGYTVLGYVHHRTGDLADAEENARLGLELADRVGAGTPVHWYAVSTLISVLIARGQVGEAWALAERLRFREPYPNAVVFPDPQVVRAELLLAQGEFAQAATNAAQAGARLDRRGMRNSALSGWQRVLVTAHARLGELDQARAVAADQRRRAERYGTLSARGAATRVCAEVEPDSQVRLSLLHTAVQMLERAPAPYERARALADLPQALHADGRPAAAAYHRALQAAEACSADALVRRARGALMEELGSAPAPAAERVELTHGRK